MLAITIQPYSYEQINELKDLKSICVLKFQHRSVIPDDFDYRIRINGDFKDILKSSTLEEIYNEIIKNIEKDYVVTYNANLLISTLTVIAKELGKSLSSDTKNHIIDLMGTYARIHNSGRYARTGVALNYYTKKTEKIDTSNPFAMSKASVKLYRLMQNKDEI